MSTTMMDASSITRKSRATTCTEEETYLYVCVCVCMCVFVVGVCGTTPPAKGIREMCVCVTHWQHTHMHLVCSTLLFQVTNDISLAHKLPSCTHILTSTVCTPTPTWAQTHARTHPHDYSHLYCLLTSNKYVHSSAHSCTGGLGACQCDDCAALPTQ